MKGNRYNEIIPLRKRMSACRKRENGKSKDSLDPRNAPGKPPLIKYEKSLKKGRDEKEKRNSLVSKKTGPLKQQKKLEGQKKSTGNI